MNKDDAWWLKAFFLCSGIIFGFVIWKASTTVALSYGWTERNEDLSHGLSLVLSVIGAGLGVWQLGRDQERHAYLLASIGELRKVSWPSLIDTRRMTLIVCVVVGIFAVILALFDLVWGRLLSFLLS